MKKFEYFLAQLETLIATAAKQKNPGLWLYQNNFRTPLFMLEGLCKMYASFHNKKKFSKLKERFKFLEDILGSIDYYDAFAKEFATNKKIPAAVTAWLQTQVKNKVTALNDYLNDKEWLVKNRRINKIRKDLQEADWQKDKKAIKSTKEFYDVSIKLITGFVDVKHFHFENIEADVHELRRKLRWLSIYPQALRGSIQLSKNNKTPAHLAKYLTKEIVTSPFNKMPDAGDNDCFLLLDQQYFLSLSWMIAELGKLKDNGLRAVALQEALQQTEKLNGFDALDKAYALLGKGQVKTGNILDQADAICKTFFREKNLDKLVVGIADVVPGDK